MLEITSQHDLAPPGSDSDSYTISSQDEKGQNITDAEIVEHQSTHLTPWQTLKIDNNLPIKAFEDMCPDQIANCLDNSTYGGKATKLGFLAQPAVLGRTGSWAQQHFNYRLTPVGFGVPLSYYEKFINYEKNSELKAALGKFIGEEEAFVAKTPDDNRQRSAQRKKDLDKIRELFYHASFPPQMLSDLRAALANLRTQYAKAYTELNPKPLAKIKVRSSGNTEDIPGFDGAGLHDSFSASLKGNTMQDGPCEIKFSDEVETKSDMNPKTFTCAIKGFYASLWNQRAVLHQGLKRRWPSPLSWTTVARFP